MSISKFHLPFYLLFSIFYFSSHWVVAQNKSFNIDTLTHNIDGNYAPFNTVKAGDTLLFETGSREYCLIQNLKGEEGKPIILINKKGVVRIHSAHYYGFSIRNCQHFRVTGTGDPDHFYGFMIDRVETGNGIGIGEGSSNFEIDHISIENTAGTGITAKTDPDCNLIYTRDKFTQFETLIHDNYISNVAHEGMYIGSTKYYGQNVNCNGKDTLLMPHLLDGVRIYNNIVEHTGWDGIQVSSASKDCKLYDNAVMFDSQQEFYNQMSGILIGGGSKCDCYNNFVSHGKGNGIESHGLGGFKIFNNIIEFAGKSFLPYDSTQMRHGIFIGDEAQKDSSFSILFNDIISPKSDGIRFSSTNSKNSLIASNIIIDPGNYDFYENGPTSHTGEDAYIMLPDQPIEINIQNNYKKRSADSAGFAAGSYTPTNGSPLIDAGYDDNRNITFDLYHHNRPFSNRFDIGAIEYDPQYQGVAEEKAVIRQGLVIIPNPVKDTFTLRYNADGAPFTAIEIFNELGKTIYRVDIKGVHQGEQNLTINAQGFKHGIYLVQLRSNKQTVVGRFVKID